MSLHMLPKRLPTLQKKYWIPLVLVAIICVIAFGACLFQPAKPAYETEAVGRGDVVEKVRVTGQVQAKAIYDLRFEADGTVATIPVQVGDVVDAGTTLSVLDAKEQELAVAEADARVRYYEAQLQKIRAGSTTEAVRVAEQMRNKAREQEQLTIVQIQNATKLQDEAMKQTNAQIATAQTDVNSLRSELKSLELQIIADIRDAEVRYENAVAALSDVSAEVGSEQAATEQEIANAREQLFLTIQSSFVDMEDALNTMDTLLGYSDPTSDDDLESVFSILDAQAENDARSHFLQARTSVKELRVYIASNQTPTSNVEQVQKTTAKVKTALEDMRRALDASVTSSRVSQATLDGYKSTISGHIADMNAVNTDVQSDLQQYVNAQLQNVSTGSSGSTSSSQKQYEVNSAQQNLEKVKSTSALQRTQLKSKISSAEKTLEQAVITQGQTTAEWNTKLRELEQNRVSAHVDVTTKEAELKEVSAAPRGVDIAPYVAELEQAKVQLDQARDHLDDFILRAPVHGVVTDIAFEVGEKVTPADVHVVLNALEKEVKVDVAETDIARLSIDAPVMMTFDAFDYSEEFMGHVVALDPAETVIDGVTYYTVTVQLNEDDARIRSGMTANMEIVSGTARDVLLVPALAVKYEGTKRYVEVVRNGKKEQVFITIGLEGDLVYEVTSGLVEGDQVVTYEE